MNLYLLVNLGDSSVVVADNDTGEEALKHFVQEYPDATVTVMDRATEAAVGPTQALTDYLADITEEGEAA